MNDRLAQVIDMAAARVEVEGAAKLAASLQRDKDGNVHPTHSNALAILAHDPILTGLAAYDAFTHRHMVTRAPPVAVDGAPLLPGPYPRPWTDADVVLIASYMQRVYSHRFKLEVISAGLSTHALQDQYHPVVDWLASLKWDSVPRLDQWLCKAFGTPDDEYHSAVGAKTLIAAVRRVRRPGVKFDTMLVIEGLQNLGKSTAIRIMASDDWFSDSIPANLENKDAAMTLAGRWLVEFAELQHVVRSEVETIKAFLSRSTDRFRPPYGRFVQDYPRQSIFIGTTNESDYLRDTTGNRRFWPITAQYVDLEWLTANRDQLWAEAAAREAANEPIYLDEQSTRDAATAQQGERLETDVWTSAILRHVAGLNRVTVADILSECLTIDKARQGRREQLRVAGVLRSSGWTVKVERGYDGVQKPLRVYYAPERT